jgi:hypothetical protein
MPSVGCRMRVRVCVADPQCSGVGGGDESGLRTRVLFEGYTVGLYHLSDNA